MRHSWIIILIITIIVGVIFGTFTNPFIQIENKNLNTPHPTPTAIFVNYTASFVIFTNGTFRIFTDFKYHNLSPAVFLEGSNPNIIHVKKEGITYQDFFNTLPMKLDKNCIVTGTNQTFCSGERNKLRFFLNGIEDPNALDKIIQPNDKLLITFGNLTELEIQNQLNRIPTP